MGPNGKTYRQIAEEYFDWLVERLDTVSEGRGYDVLIGLYDRTVFSGTFPMNLPAHAKLQSYFTELESRGQTLTRNDREEISWEVESVLAERLERRGLP